MTCTALSACGGSGGGPGPRPIVDNPGNGFYTTPVAQATLDPLAGPTNNAHEVFDTHVTDIDGDGASDDVIFVGRRTATGDPANEWEDSRISVLSFENGSLIDKTAQWFSGTDNIIKGSEPSVQFTDFFKTGRNDMFVAHSTDNTVITGPAHVFKNTGNSFEKIEIPTVGIWSHGSDVGDLNNDTYDDIIMLDYGPNTTIALNNTVNGFTTYTDPLGVNGDLRFGGSGVAIGNYLNDGGNNEIIIADGSCPTGTNYASCSSSARTKMFSVDFTGGTLKYTYIKDLPASAYAATNDHHVRVVNHDFNEDGNEDVIVFSRPFNWFTEGSDIQFLANDGAGDFTDTTADVLIGYNRDTHVTYQPKFFDLNGDGKIDILVSAGDYAGANNSHQFLLKTQDNKFVAAYQNVLTGFLSDIEAQLPYSETQGATINIFQGDDGNKYLISWTHPVNSDRKMTVFMSRLDGNPIAAGTAVTMLQDAWPYLSDAQATQALIDTSTPFAGSNIIDINKAFQPIGQLSMSGLTLNGYIAGFDVGNVTGVAVDTVGKGYNVSLSQSQVNYKQTMYTSVDSVNGYKFDNGQTNFTADDTKQEYTIGQNVYTNGDFKYNVHFTSLNKNPWIDFNGVWGEINGSNIVDNVASYAKDKVTLKASLMYVTTKFSKGLINNVGPQFGAWAEGEYQNNGFFGAVGIQPSMLSGNISASIPTHIDNSGTTHYTNYKFKLPRSINAYLKGSYKTNFGIGDLSMAGAVLQTGVGNASIAWTAKW